MIKRKYGHIVMKQPGQFAWQLFDSSVGHLLRPEYRARRVTKVVASSIEELAEKIEDVNTDQLLATIRAFNAAVKRDVPFDPFDAADAPAGDPVAEPFVDDSVDMSAHSMQPGARPGTQSTGWPVYAVASRRPICHSQRGPSS